MKKYGMRTSGACLLLACLISSGEDLSLSNLVERTLENNSRVKVEHLAVQEKAFELGAEEAWYIPEVYLTLTKSALERENTEEQSRSQGLGGNSVYANEDAVAEGGIEGLALTGMQYRVGLSVNELGNTLNNYDEEYTSFAGIEITQPILRGFGSDITRLRVRLATVESGIARLQLEKQMIGTVAQAERLYWELYYAQQEKVLRQESVSVSRKILEDNEARVKQGKMAGREVEQAKSGLAMRLAQFDASEQDYVDAASRIRTLLNEKGYDLAPYQAIDAPPSSQAIAPDFEARMARALERNPDYLLRVRERDVADVHVVNAEDQHRPKLDLVGRFGYSSLDEDDAGSSFGDLGDTEFESWAIGVSFRMPLGRRASRNRIRAAESRVSQAEEDIRGAELEIGNLLDSSIKRAISSGGQVDRYRQVVTHNEKILADELLRLEQGKSDSRKVLEAEEDLTEAKADLLLSVVNFRRAVIGLRLVEGTLLDAHNVDLTE